MEVIVTMCWIEGNYVRSPRIVTGGWSVTQLIHVIITIISIGHDLVIMDEDGFRFTIKEEVKKRVSQHHHIT